MSIYRNFLLGAAFCMTFALSAIAEDVTGDTIVATVGDKVITVGHMAAMTMSLPEEQRQLPPEMIFEGVLERLIQQEAVAQSRPRLTKRSALQLANERRSLVASEVVNEMAEKINVTPEQVQELYDQQFKNSEPAPEFNASHILVETEEEAKTIMNALKQGGDFADQARQHSIGPSGPSGGNLGWFGLGRMVPAFEAAVTELEVGQVSAPVETQFGWHLIILNDVRKPGIPMLADVRGELENQLWRQALQAEIAALVDQVIIVRADVADIPVSVITDPAMLED